MTSHDLHTWAISSPPCSVFSKGDHGLPWRGAVGVLVDCTEDTEPNLMVNRSMEKNQRNGNNKDGRGAITWGRIFFGGCIISHLYIHIARFAKTLAISQMQNN